jgi:hypothetical protein
MPSFHRDLRALAIRWCESDTAVDGMSVAEKLFSDCNWILPHAQRLALSPERAHEDGEREFGWG